MWQISTPNRPKIPLAASWSEICSINVSLTKGSKAFFTVVFSSTKGAVAWTPWWQKATPAVNNLTTTQNIETNINKRWWSIVETSFILATLPRCCLREFLSQLISCTAKIRMKHLQTHKGSLCLQSNRNWHGASQIVQRALILLKTLHSTHYPTIIDSPITFVDMTVHDNICIPSPKSDWVHNSI